MLSNRDSVTFIEWSQNIKELLPKDCITVSIKFVKNGEDDVAVDKYVENHSNSYKNSKNEACGENIEGVQYREFDIGGV